MSLQSYDQILSMLEDGVVENSRPENVNSASLDLTLGRYIIIEREGEPQDLVSLARRDPLTSTRIDLKESETFILSPGQFILAQTQEIFNLPCDLSAEYKLKSSMARIGLEHLNAGWCDAGWNGSVLTLELKNMTQQHCIELTYGDKIGQIVFFKHTPVPLAASYASRGRYNKDVHVTEIKK